MIQILEQENDEFYRERERKINQFKPRDRSVYEEYMRYADLHGTEKTQKMLEDEIAHYEESIKEKVPYHTSYRRESDGMIKAGMASAIGGTVPAMASLANTARKNESVREYNKALAVMDLEMRRLESEARKAMEKRIERGKESLKKLIAELPQEELLQDLYFYNEKLRTTCAGSVEVTINVSCSGKLIIYNQLKARVDGSVVAEILDDQDKKIGEAVLVLPMCGCISTSIRFSDPIVLHGIALFCGEPEKNYKLGKIAPRDLWAVEY